MGAGEVDTKKNGESFESLKKKGKRRGLKKRKITGERSWIGKSILTVFDGEVQVEVNLRLGSL